MQIQWWSLKEGMQPDVQSDYILNKVALLFNLFSDLQRDNILSNLIYLFLLRFIYEVDIVV